ncbi:hypothetical protein CONPUDRAFT_35649, partial [Coniophora puteana RWD-64-598 SS2]
WPSVFSALTILSNRETVYHSDRGAYRQWYDIVSSFGSYWPQQFSVPQLGIDLHYRPGSVVPFCGKVFQHGVPKCKGGRICLAYYMKKSIHE